MRVLVACEYSGIVRDAFADKGHYAVSCDLLPTESVKSEGYHYQGDVRDILYDSWDMMIAHPPCTYLAVSGARWFDEDKHGDKAWERKQLRLEAIDFVNLLWNSGIPKIAIENPVGFLSSMWKKPSQIVQPYYFGDTEYKNICLWLKGLPLLEKTNVVEPTVYGYRNNKKQGKTKVYYTHKCNIPKDRSKFFTGIAKAMVDQWS
jgi:site-specific DNA-cytosine methylase